MSLGSDVAAALPGFRAEAESQMVSTCTITSDGVKVWDEETGGYVESGTTVYSGPCKLRFPPQGRSLRELDVQGQFLIEQEPLLSLPVAGSELVSPGDVVTITANPFDPAMVGLKIRIAGVHTQTFATARRFPVEVVTGD